MRAEDTLQFMADFYPDLFPTRKHALDFLFCTIGNGYEWKKGELVEEDGEFENRYALKKPIKKATFRNEDIWNMRASANELKKELGKEANPEYIFKWYPISEYSYIRDFPKNIKPDWKALMEECIALLEEDGIVEKGELSV